MAFPPKYGADTDSVLAEAGYRAEDLAALRAGGIIADAGP